MLVNGRPWDGKIHFDGEPDRFRRMDALMFPARAAQKEDDMTEVTIPVVVIGALAFLCTVVGGVIGALATCRSFEKELRKPWQRMGL